MWGAISAYFHCKYGRDKAYYQILKDIFGIHPNNIELYKLALLHRSASLFLDDGTPINNERLEFLGDAVIESIVSDYLFIEFPEENEGFLSRLRSRIVSRSSLNALAQKIGLHHHVIVQGGSGFLQKHLYGDAFEAMMGAIYLDKGYDFANRLLINEIIRRYVDIEQMTDQESDFKSRLIEWSQKTRRLMQFETSPSEQYSSQKPHFRTTIFLDHQPYGKGEGSSKKESEQRAAQTTIALLEAQDEHILSEEGL
ncbi:MAG: ribonuclease III [Alistipes sp.]|nr:ribonuclease III [Alistipes sp.]